MALLPLEQIIIDNLYCLPKTLQHLDASIALDYGSEYTTENIQKSIEDLKYLGLIRIIKVGSKKHMPLFADKPLFALTRAGKANKSKELGRFANIT